MTRRCGEGIGAMGTSVTYVAGTYNGFVLLAAPILRTCQRTNRFPNGSAIFSHMNPLIHRLSRCHFSNVMFLSGVLMINIMVDTFQLSESNYNCNTYVLTCLWYIFEFSDSGK